MTKGKRLVEVFVERDCPSCEEVLKLVDTYRDDSSIDVQVYEREAHAPVFRERRVVICPATFVDHRLVFYGAFTMNELARYLL